MGAKASWPRPHMSSVPPRHSRRSWLRRVARRGPGAGISQCGSAVSGVYVGSSSRALDTAATTLRLAAALAGRSTRFRRYPPGGRVGRRRDERPQPRECVVAVVRLAAMVLREDDDFSGRVQASSRGALQPGAQSLREVRAREVQAQLDGGRDLVDVLSAGSRCADELDRQRVLRHACPSCYFNQCHRCTIVRGAACRQGTSGRGNTQCFRKRTSNAIAPAAMSFGTTGCPRKWYNEAESRRGETAVQLQSHGLIEKGNE